MKRCGRCNKDKPATAEYFHGNNQTDDNLHPYCKECRNSARRKYHWDHKEEENAKNKEWASSHPQKYREGQRDWRNRNREKRLPVIRERYRNNRAYHLMRSAQYSTLYPKQYRAHLAVRLAIKRGDLVKPQICDTCKQKGRIHAHHKDYLQPLVVQWLCSLCHGLAHAKYK